MKSFREFVPSGARLRLYISTLVCLIFLGMLIEAWREDVFFAGLEIGGATLSVGETDTDYGSLSLDQAEPEAQLSDEPSDSTATPSEPLPRPAIVAGAVVEETLAWMQNMTADYDVFPFIVTNASMPAHLAVPANKGREAMVYLSYLIHNYDNLPPYAIFTHGHRTAWHQERDIVDMIYDLQVPALEETQYVSLRFSWSPSCPAELRPKTHDAVVWGDGLHLRETEDAIEQAWPTLFPNEELPDTIASQCCAQFAVTREAMRRRTKDDYIRMRQWLLDTPLDDSVSGRVFEKLWAYIMLGEAVHCPAPQTCACKYFGYCESHVWPTPPPELGQLPPEK